MIASIVCLTKILNNFLLYLTRTQGYGPDTIVEKLVRYLFLTSAINFGLVWLVLPFSLPFFLRCDKIQHKGCIIVSNMVDSLVNER